MRKSSFLALSLVLASVPAGAAIGTIDDVPAATLLLPYFEVDLDNVDCINTLFSINNASATAVIAHVTFWSTWSIPVIDFDVYLTGYDVQTINVRDVLLLGNLPRTASAGQDPTDTISPQGPISQDINFASCNGFLPYDNPAVSEAFRAHLRALLTGKPSPVNGVCAGTDYGDSFARGYVTVDVTRACSQLFPADAGYFGAGGTGIATDQNVIWGDYLFVDPLQGYAQGDALVAVEAAPRAFAPGDYTFYGRYVGGTASDDREPLPSRFATRYIEGGAFTGGTDLLVWRDSKFPPGGSCQSGPNYGELFERQVVAFDELENPFTVQQGGPSGEPVPGAECLFCDESQRVAVGDAIDLPADFGWLFLDLDHTTTLDAGLGAGYVGVAQGWVTTVMSAQGRYAVGLPAFSVPETAPGPPVD